MYMQGRTISRWSDFFYFTVGVVFLFLAKVKHSLMGYSTPKPFGVNEIDRAVSYDESVVAGWLMELTNYYAPNQSLTCRELLANRSVLELGPGSDLGIGLLLLAKGAERYTAVDVHNLVERAPSGFYDALFRKIKSPDVGDVRNQLNCFRAGIPSRLNYRVSSDFNLVSAAGTQMIDLVVSQAAMEHFEDVDTVFRQLTQVCRPGAILIAEVDLKTHSRWILDRDPNNIYRYPDWLYNLFRFRGQPNRLRPQDYKRALEKHGWQNVQIVPQVKTAKDIGRWSKRFRSDDSQMEILTMTLRATRGL
jgi:SAM-dependent methyltransferase